MRRAVLLLMIFIGTLATPGAGDTIINAWGSLQYGWIDSDTFGIQLTGSPQIQQIEQDWPRSVLLLTNFARRTKDDVCAWQVRKGQDAETLQLVPNDFGRARSYTPDGSAGSNGDSPLYSQFTFIIPRLFDGHVMYAEGDYIELRLCWFTEDVLFSFLVPKLPALTQQEQSAPRETPPPDGTGASPDSHTGTPNEPPAGPETSSTFDQTDGVTLPPSVATAPLASPPATEEMPEAEAADVLPAIEPLDTQATTQSRSETAAPSAQRAGLPPRQSESPPEAVQDAIELRTSYIQGDLIEGMIPRPPGAGRSADLAIVERHPGSDPILVQYSTIAYDPAKDSFAVRVATADLSPGTYELIVWITGEKVPFRSIFQVLLESTSR